MRKDQDVNYKSKESVSPDQAVAEAKSDRSGFQEEQDAVMEYRVKSKDPCVAKAESREGARDAVRRSLLG